MIENIYSKHKETIHNFFWRALQIFGKQGVTFLIFIVCAKVLSPYDFGIYNYVLAIIFFLIIFGDFGISTATSKYVAEYNAVNQKKLESVLFSSALIIFVFALIVSLFVLVYGKLIFPEQYKYIFYLLPLVFFAPMTSLYDGIYRGLKRFKQLSVISLIVGFVSLVFVYFLIKSYGLVGALIAQNLFYITLFLFLASGYKNFNFKLNKKIMIEIGKYSLLVGIANLSLFLYTRIDVIILGQLGFIEEIGYYEIINKIFMILMMPITLLGTVVAPNTTKNFAFKKYSYIKNKLMKESLFLFLVGLLVAISAFFLFPVIFNLVLPEYDFKMLTQILTLMLLLIPFRYFSSYISGGYITPSGYVKVLSTVMLIFGFLNIFLNYILIGYFGFIGVIYATLISQFLFIATKDTYFYFIVKRLINNEKIVSLNRRRLT